MSRRARHRDGLRRLRVVAIDVHGSLDRVKDASPIERCMVALRWVHAPFTRMLTAFPSSAPRGHPLSPARPKKEEETPFHESDRPRPPFPRRPAKGGAIPKTKVPSTVASQRCERIAPPNLSNGLSLTPPTRCPRLWDRAF
jgi:hypothetical protein